MKLLLLTENWPPQVGGIENYLWHVVQALITKGHDVTVVAPKLVKGEGKAARLEKDEEDFDGQRDVSAGDTAAIKVIRKSFRARLGRPRWWRLYRWVKKRARAEQYDAVMCGKGLLEGLIGYLLKQQIGIPYAVFTYGMEIEVWSKRWREKKKLKGVLKEAVVVFCINEQTKESLKALGVKEDKIIKAWPGVDEKMFRLITEEVIVEVLKKYEIRRPYIISVGRFIERKGFDNLIEAFGRLDQTKFGNTQLVLVGDGPQLSALQNMVEGEMIDSSVLLLPEVPDEDLPALYAGAVLFALTPRDIDGDIEGFGIVYLEAAAQGVPAIGTKTGGVPEAVIDGGTGILVEPNNVAAITKAMARVLSDKNFKQKLGEAAKNRVASKFQWSERIKVIEGAISKTVVM